ncbi:MAG TPA: polysaccharide biosynthesis protein [Candidatus Scatomonas pullistercoris]|uniref:Polysaccharide biosynthesis protein n=1 Tax=Candidatus Scatomonas pullistercoris TaxID=2840920 RepID=A0A9D1TAD6_9FIRM|nr:polysaccharide biosynthesis protein [Candidatus Scatomonas pullistercoris]
MGKRNSLIKNASILMVASIISRIIGLIYRRPLGEVLGSVGLGYYGYASNLYSILLLISSYSIPMAVSKIVSERLALKQYKSAHKVFRGALLYAVLVGGATALITFFFGRFLLPMNQQNAVPALQVLAPTIFLSAILGVFRGYFQAHQNMTPTSVSQIAEQIMNAVVSIAAAVILVNRFAPAGEEAVYGAVGGTLGTGAGVLTGLAFMIFVYMLNRGILRRQRARDRHRREETYGDVFRIIFFLMTPIIFTTFINNASTYLDSYLYSSIQGFHGIDGDLISAAYGEFSNYYVPIINIPLAMASASASAMMPEVSGCYAMNRKKEASGQINQTIRLTMFICIPATVGLMVLAHPVMGVLFPSSTELAERLLMTGAVYVIFSALATITSSVLQSIGQQKWALINAGISLILNLAVLALLLLLFPGLDIYAVMIANILFSVVICLLNAVSIRKFLGHRNEWKKTYLQPLIASAGMGLVAFAVYQGLFLLTRRPFIALLVSVVLAVLVYLILYVIVTKTSEEEMRKFPMGGKLVKVLRMLKIYR